MIFNLLLLLPLFIIFYLFLIPSFDAVQIKKVSLLGSLLLVFFSIVLFLTYQPLNTMFQQSIFQYWAFGISLMLGIDSFSILFIMLTTFIFSICVLYVWDNPAYLTKNFYILLFLMEFFLIIIFSCLDIFVFYFFFESILIPMFCIIGIWGSRAKKIKAAYLLVFYTLIGSISFLGAIIYLYLKYNTTELPILMDIVFTYKEQLYLWVAFFLAFASKVPMVPFHIWLPEAHVEAPTTGSVILAGILLKLGIFGFLRFTIPLLPAANYYYLPFIYTLATIGIIYAAITAIRQIDLKRIIAYSSISHMNLIVLGLFSSSVSGLQGAILQSLSHGFVASGLFILIGIIYDKYHTRMITYYGGLFHVMPLYSFFFLIFILSNIAFPGTSNFSGEFLILLSTFLINPTITIFGASGMILGSIYSLWLLNKLLYGNIKQYCHFLYSDISEREFFILSLLSFFILILGIYPSPVLLLLL